MSAVISVVGLKKQYGNTAAVDGINLEIHEGEVFALLGPNGAGKTTTVEILEGFRDRSAGTVEVLGTDPQHGGRALRERIGIVLQQAGLDPYLTRRRLSSTPAVLPAPSSGGRAARPGRPSEKAGSRVKTLSGGQQRRLDLALALVGDPDLIFLDEPTTGFDPSARRNAWVIIEDLCRLGKTVLLTTHYMDEAQHLADRVAVIAGGRIVAEGTPDVIGGRDRAAVRIRFALPPGVRSTRYRSLPRRSPVTRAATSRFEHREPTPLLHELTRWALEQYIELVGLTVTRPTFEDVYLELTAPPA